MIRDAHSWFDDVAKKVEQINDVSHKKKISSLNKLFTDYGKDGPEKIAAVKEASGILLDVVNNLDSEQIEDRSGNV